MALKPKTGMTKKAEKKAAKAEKKEAKLVATRGNMLFNERWKQAEATSIPKYFSWWYVNICVCVCVCMCACTEWPPVQQVRPAVRVVQSLMFEKEQCNILWILISVHALSSSFAVSCSSSLPPSLPLAATVC